MNDFKARAREAARVHSDSVSDEAVITGGFTLAESFQEGALWSRAETLREVVELLLTRKAPYEGAAVMKNRAMCAEFIRERFAAEMGEGK